MIDGFSEIQLQYYRLHATDDAGSAKTAAKKQTNGAGDLRTSVQSALWGCIFAVIIFVFVIFFVYIIDVRLRYTDDCTILYQILLLGRIPASRNQRHFSMMWISGYPNTGTKKDI